MSDEAVVVVRPFDQVKDLAFVMATWRNSSYYGNGLNKGPKHRWFKKKTAEIKDIIPKATIEIACLKDSPDTIIGFVVSRGTHLDWIYVKVEYRLMGIATLMMPPGIDTVTPDLTKIGEAILKKKNITKETEDGTTRDGIEAGTEAKNKN